MHASVLELLENVKPGLLWVTLEGVVRYANPEASARTGLGIGHRLCDLVLTRAVSDVIARGEPRAFITTSLGGPDGQPRGELKCRVIPGLAGDDAFLLLTPDDGHDAETGFDNLMQAIRTEVRDPLRQVKAALALSESRGEANDEQQAIHDGVQQLLGVVDRLVELARLWHTEAMLANDRIELWPLLQQVWGEVEPLALQRGVQVRFRPQAEVSSLVTLYGSERWLGHVFRECLEAAVRSTRRDGVIDIEHRQLGPRALVVFRDCGVFATRQARTDEVDWLLDTQAQALHAPIQDLIGLRLCKRIVLLHGGRLREEREGGMRDFLIELPTGAPHHIEQSQLAMAQAQVYAQDLAALMKRAAVAKAALANGTS